ncbi:MAG: response regulator transcription factor [Ignavibacteriales bacterium]|nr:response regulator transcription factor [Ignavibacteriales bacterium]
MMNIEVYLFITLSCALAFSVVFTIFRFYEKKEAIVKENQKLIKENELITLRGIVKESVEQIIGKNSTNKNTGAAIFTNRELEVGNLLVTGLTSKEIADKLNIAISTSNNHVENMKEKAGCKNKAELAAYLLKHDIV